MCLLINTNALQCCYSFGGGVIKTSSYQYVCKHDTRFPKCPAQIVFLEDTAIDPDSGEFTDSGEFRNGNSPLSGSIAVSSKNTIQSYFWKISFIALGIRETVCHVQTYW